MNLFFKNQMNCNYETDEIRLWRIVNRHIPPTNEDSENKFHIYYKTRKLSKIIETKSMTLLCNIMLSTCINVK